MGHVRVKFRRNSVERLNSTKFALKVHSSVLISLINFSFGSFRVGGLKQPNDFDLNLKLRRLKF